MSADLYLPRPATVMQVERFTEREVYLRVALQAPLGHRPGQFVMVSLLGIGEAPISVSSGPRSDNELEMVVRDAGSLTKVLCAAKVGDVIGVRGPFGSGFHLEQLYGKDVLFVCGGLGLVPLRSLILPVLAERERFGRVVLISGCRTPADELYRDELAAWEARGDVEVIRLVDRTEHQPWTGRVGLVTAPIPDLGLDPDRLVAALCGPPVMYKFVVLALHGAGVDDHQIYVDLERRMRCGVGKCGHCQLNDLTCCRQGPVFQLSELATRQEALR